MLEPLYEGTIERMDTMVAEWRRAHPNQPLPTGNTHMARFVERLKDLARHPSQRYFVLKTIVLQNLYGVDIMEEAVEICKLRLFLKLVAQLESADQIEPLPDLDFNVRAGNTLVGFATEQQAKDAITSDIAEAASWPGIQYAAQQASGTFTLFREAQADPNANADHIREWKRLLNEQLQDLRNQLDAALARQHGIDDPAAKPKKFATWRESHQPFHWFVEFYGILHDGGFDAIIGNPPYVAMSKLRKQYSLYGFDTAACSDVYAPVLERVTQLIAKSGWTGMIVPLSLTFSSDFGLLRDLIYQRYNGNWFSSFARIPAALFSHDVRVRNTIHIGARLSKPVTAATRLHRWFEEARDVLFNTVSYSHFTSGTWENKIPRIPSAALGKALENLVRDYGQLQNAFVKNGKHKLHFKKSAYNWLCFCKKLPPCYDESGKSIEHTKFGTVSFQDKVARDLTFLLTNGKLNFIWWCIVGDDFDVTQWMFATFPLDVTKLPQALVERLLPIAPELEHAMKENTSFKLNAGKRVGNYNLARCREVTDKSDAIFAEALGLDTMWEHIEQLYSQIIKTTFGAE